MNYFVFLPASEAKNSKDKRRSVYQSDYLDIRLKRKMSDEEESNEIVNNEIENDEQEQEGLEENDTNEQQEIQENGTNDDGMLSLVIKIKTITC